MGTALTSCHWPTAVLGEMLHFSTTTAWHKGPGLGKQIVRMGLKLVKASVIDNYGCCCQMGLNWMEFLSYLQSHCIDQFSVSLQDFLWISNFPVRGSWIESVRQAIWDTPEGGQPSIIFRSPGLLTLLKEQKSASPKLCFIYCPSSRASKKAVVPNKIGLRSKHRSMQPVWWTW